MSFVPTLFLWVALVLAAALSLTFGRRSRAISYLVPAVLLLALPAFIFLRPDSTPELAFAGWRFALPAPARQLSAVVSLLGLATLLPVTLSQDNDASRLAGIGGLVTAGAWLVIWAGDLFTTAAAVTLFALAWLWFAWLARANENSTRWWRGALWMFAAPFAVWLAAAALGPTGGGSSGIAAAALLLAGWLAAGVWPLGGWRNVAGEARPPLRALLLGTPVVVGAALVLPLASGVALSRGTLILATVPALLGLAVGLRTAWARPMTITSLADGASLALAGLVLPAAAWTGVAGVIAAARLAVFVPALLLLVLPVGRDANGARASKAATLAALLAVLAAVAALPFTAGFGVLAPLYSGWSSGTALLLILVAAVLMMAWIAAVGRLLLRERSSPESLRQRPAPAVLAALGLAALGLLWFDAAALADTTPVAWAALGLSLVGGLVLPRLLAGHDAWREALRDTLTLEPGAAPLRAAEGAARTAINAAADAATLLEGDYGLVWLLAVLGLLLLFG